MNTKLTKEQIEAAAKWCAGVLRDEPFTRKGLSRNAPEFTEIMSRSGRNLNGSMSCREYINDMNTARRLWLHFAETTDMSGEEISAMLGFPRHSYKDCPAAIYTLGVALGEIDPNECTTNLVDSQIEEEVSDK